MTPVAVLLSMWAWWLVHQPRCPHWLKPAAWGLFATWTMGAIAMFVGRTRMLHGLDSSEPLYRQRALGAGIKLSVNATALAAGALVAAAIVLIVVSIWMRGHRVAAFRSFGPR